MDVYGCLGVYGCLWLWELMRVMGVCESLWVVIDRYGRLQVSMGVWGCMGVYGWLWELIGVYECVDGLGVYGFMDLCLWGYMGVWVCLWVSMSIYGGMSRGGNSEKCIEVEK